MGTVRFTYEVERARVSTLTIVSEIEYGSSYALLPNGERIITGPSEELEWVTWSADGNRIIIDVNDDFLESGYFFEKTFASFVFNLLDFGEFYLVSIDLSKSRLAQTLAGFFAKNENTVMLSNRRRPLLGTIYKPYYHLPLREKVAIAERFVSTGGDILKEDETYFADRESVLKESKAIQSSIGQKGFYVPNVTHLVRDYDLISELLSLGIRIVMLDYLVCGFGCVHDLKSRVPQMLLWGHRVGYSVYEKVISMDAIVTLAVLSGLHFVHVGTPKDDVERGAKLALVRNMRGVNASAYPVFTKTTPNGARELLSSFGPDIVILACGYFRSAGSSGVNWSRVQDWIEAGRHGPS